MVIKLDFTTLPVLVSIIGFTLIKLLNLNIDSWLSSTQNENYFLQNHSIESP